MKKKLIGTILTLLCTGVVAFSGWQVYKIMSEYQFGEKVYLELEEYVSPPTEEKIQITKRNHLSLKTRRYYLLSSLRN